MDKRLDTQGDTVYTVWVTSKKKNMYDENFYADLQREEEAQMKAERDAEYAEMNYAPSEGF